MKAVDGVSFTVREGETLGVVGESGCGKSTMARCIMRLLDPTGGRVIFDGRDITHLSRAEMRPFRREMMMIFQDPYASLNPRKRVGFIVAEALEVHKLGTDAEIKRRVQELLEVVGLNPEHYNRFPHEFSGGQRQRIGVARALAVNPKLIVCDEPVSALDVSVQAQILNLLKDLQREFGLTYVFIAHDLNVVRHISDRVMVMYLGKVVEVANRDAALHASRSTRTRARCSPPCRSRIPSSAATARAIVLEGDVPSPLNPPTACRFHPRCPRFHEGHCDVEEPQLYPFGDGHVGGLPLPARALADDRGRDPPHLAAARLGLGPAGAPRAPRAPAARAARGRARRFVVLLGGVAATTAVVSRPARRCSSARRSTGRSRSGSTSSAASCSSPASSSATAGRRGRRARPARRSSGSASCAGPRRAEREETINDSAIFVTIGFVLLLLGVSSTAGHSLFNSLVVADTFD